MKKFNLNQKESLTVFDIVQDAIDRGMIASYYELKSFEEAINMVTNEYGDIFNKKIKITIEIGE